jgi:hypothetical protein
VGLVGSDGGCAPEALLWGRWLAVYMRDQAEIKHYVFANVRVGSATTCGTPFLGLPAPTWATLNPSLMWLHSESLVESRYRMAAPWILMESRHRISPSGVSSHR